MKKREIVKDNKKFNEIINKGSQVKNKYFIIYKEKKKQSFPNFGIAVGTKIGNACIRNKYKRKIRAILDENKNVFQNDTDYIIIMKKTCLDINYKQMSDELVKLIESK